ncbi:MAG: hypothetical protein LBD30_07990 [Verrucomicrobiales bacterium]|jgi:hypothetical protein|nr:hypothetical protein [Verrucomicrobiales bacterium]
MSILEQLQAAAAARLGAEPEFAGVSVSVIRPRSEEEAVLIQIAIDNALAGVGGNGLAALVQMPTLSAPMPNAPGPVIDMALTVRIIENPLVSGARRSAEDLALATLSALHHYAPRLDDLTLLNPLFADGNCLEPVDGFAGKIVYDVTVKTKYDGLAGRN